MIVLALDTSLSLASAGLWDALRGVEIGRESVMVGRGHETLLLSLVADLLEKSRIQFRHIDRIAVTVGPGSFTGLRISVSAARAFSLALGKPAVGISTLAGFAASAISHTQGAFIVSAVDARRGRVFAQIFSADGRPLGPARLCEPRALIETIDPGPLCLIGDAAPLVADAAWRCGRQIASTITLAGPDIGAVGKLGALADPDRSPPRPIYVEEAATTIPSKDASPASSAAQDP